MVREPLTAQDRQRGAQLGSLLRHARGGRTAVEIATGAGLAVETLRKIEAGRVPTPAFFTVAAVARQVGLSLDEVATYCSNGAAPT